MKTELAKSNGKLKSFNAQIKELDTLNFHQETEKLDVSEAEGFVIDQHKLGFDFNKPNIFTRFPWMNETLMLTRTSTMVMGVIQNLWGKFFLF